MFWPVVSICLLLSLTLISTVSSQAVSPGLLAELAEEYDSIERRADEMAVPWMDEKYLLYTADKRNAGKTSKKAKIPRWLKLRLN